MHIEKGVDVQIGTLIFDSATTQDNVVVITGDSDLTSAFISAEKYCRVCVVGKSKWCI